MKNNDIHLVDIIRKFTMIISGIGISSIYPDQEILALLRRYNIQPTGSRESDFAAIAKAKSKETEGNNKTEGFKETHPKTPAAIAEFMEKVGLTPTNSKEGDNEVISKKLEDMEAQAKTDAEKQKVKSLKSEFASITASINGVDFNQMAALNKFFMVK